MIQIFYFLQMVKIIHILSIDFTPSILITVNFLKPCKINIHYIYLKQLFFKLIAFIL